MHILPVDPENPEPDPIERAAEIIRLGGLVAFPTETVYGLGANAFDEGAVARIYAAKGRPAYNPLIVHVADAAGAEELVTHWPPAAARLAAAFWPGPLTLVLPRHPRVPARVSAGLETVAVRVPAHPVARALLRAARVPIVAPSANRSMAVSPTRAEHVVKGLGDRVELILDGGATDIGIESTVLDLSREKPALLRPGVLSLEELSPFVGAMESGAARAGNHARPSPGMLDRHYAPRATVRLFRPAAAGDALDLARRAAAEGRTVGALVLDPDRFGDVVTAVLHTRLAMPQDARGYARELYAAFHRMDEVGCDLVLVEAVPASPEWAGVQDRLRRAGEEPPL